MNANASNISFGLAGCVCIVTGGAQGIARPAFAARYITGEIVVVDGGRMALNYTVAV